MTEVDVVDGLQKTSDNVDKLSAVISDLLERVRNLEGTLRDISEVQRRGSGCGLTCANNSFTM